MLVFRGVPQYCVGLLNRWWLNPNTGNSTTTGLGLFFGTTLQVRWAMKRGPLGCLVLFFGDEQLTQVCGDYNKLIHYKDPYQPTAIKESRRFSFPSSSELGCWFFRDDFVHGAFFQRRKHPSLHRPVRGGCIFCKKKLRIFGGDHHDHPIWRLFYLATFLFSFSCPCSFRLQNMMRISLSTPGSPINLWIAWQTTGVSGWLNKGGCFCTAVQGI